VLLVKVNNLDTDWRRRKEGRGREKEKKKSLYYNDELY